MQPSPTGQIGTLHGFLAYLREDAFHKPGRVGNVDSSRSPSFCRTCSPTSRNLQSGMTHQGRKFPEERILLLSWTSACCSSNSVGRSTLLLGWPNSPALSLPCQPPQGSDSALESQPNWPDHRLIRWCGKSLGHIPADGACQHN
jgi:hypothetical protein